jgi:quercetin dioxygenase-like cupin family protein
MNSCKRLLAVLLSCSIITAYAQHDHTGKTTTTAPPMTFNPVLNQALSDPELQYYKMESVIMNIAPGAADTVSHRHDCELFGYVLEGEVLIGLEKKEPNSFLTGQMFYEKRNVLHTLARNPNKEKPARVLLIFIIKDGRVRYTREYPEKKSDH